MSISFIHFFFFFFFFTFAFSHITPRFPSSLLSRSSSHNNNNNNGLYKTKFFTQTLDHFNYNPQSYQTFQQRYLVNDTHWGGANNKSPIFVYTGNEGNIEWFTQNTGFMFETAPRFQALLVFIEHRFYGKSVPYGGNRTIAYGNSSTLGYLSSTQALADYGTLIIDLKKNLSATDSPVLVFGGSYGGMLAAWFRLKYPHVAAGALASSAPILNFPGLVSPFVFNDIITQDFRSESENCYKVIKEAWKEIEDVDSKPGGEKQLVKSFRLCRDYGVYDVEAWLQTAMVYTAMTDYPTPSNFMNPLPAYPVKKMCEAIDSSVSGEKEKENTLLGKLYAAANVYYNSSGTQTCFDLDDNSDPHDLGGWQWQACTEMIMPQGANNNQSIFPESQWSYESNAAFCQSFFNTQPRPHWITTEFGGQDIQRVLKRSASNIIFFNGLRDPWSGGGVLKNISKTLIAIVAKEGAHHVDLRFSTKEDPKWLKDVRKKEIKIIANWISRYYEDLQSNN